MSDGGWILDANGEWILSDDGENVIWDGVADSCACCGSEFSCPFDYPWIDMTITWTGTPTDVNYQAGPPATIDLFGFTWESGDTNQICPVVYFYNTSPTGYNVYTSGVWQKGNGITNGLSCNIGRSNPFATVVSSVGESINTPAGADFDWQKGISPLGAAATGSYTKTQINTFTGGPSVFTAYAGPPIGFDQFGGQVQTSNGITITWVKGAGAIFP